MIGRLLSKIVAAPVEIANAPLRMIEDLVDEDTPDEDRIFSRPLDIVAKGIRKTGERIDGE